MRRIWNTLLLAAILVIASITIAAADEAKYTETNGVRLYDIGASKVEGYVELRGETTKSRIKLMVVKNDEQTWYEIKLEKGRFFQQLWLNKGTGKYTIYVMVNEYDRKYSYGPKLIVENTAELNAFLVPDKHIESTDKTVAAKAAEITKGLNSDIEKARAIYEWVTQNIRYDYEKYKRHLNGSYDNEYGALLALTSKKGVCYDYAALIAALGRASGIQTKVVYGTGKVNGTSGYHAWNEMYIDGQGKWIKLDATFASMSGENFFDSEKFDETHIKQ